VCACSEKPWQFKPKNFSEGQTIVGGSIFGEVCVLPL
jgi:vacuolar-type H+-ATPase catalytic subunit A/Vma1